MTVWVLVEFLVVRYIVGLSMDESTHKDGLVYGLRDGLKEEMYEGDEGRIFDDTDERSLSRSDEVEITDDRYARGVR